MSMPAASEPDDTRLENAVGRDSPGARAERLKERVYVTFTVLAVVLTLRTHASELSAGEAALTLLVTVVATLLAVFVADFVSHLAVHAALPTAGQLRHMLSVSVGSLGVIGVPMLLLLASGLGLLRMETALTAITVTLIVTLAVVGYLAVRRVKLPLLIKLLVLAVVVALGFAVVGLELFAHA